MALILGFGLGFVIINRSLVNMEGSLLAEIQMIRAQDSCVWSKVSSEGCTWDDWDDGTTSQH